MVHPFGDMVRLEEPTQCAIYDKTPNTEQKRITIIVRATHTVEKVFKDINTQYSYQKYDLVLQPNREEAELVHLNELKSKLLYHVKGFEPTQKNSLVLLPAGIWDGNIKQRFDLSLQQTPPTTLKATANGTEESKMKKLQKKTIKSSTKNTTTITTTNTTTISYTTTNNAITETDAGVEIHTKIQEEPTNKMTDILFFYEPDVDDDLLNLSPNSDHEQLSDDDLALGASASPTEPDDQHITAGGLSSLARNSPINFTIKSPTCAAMGSNGDCGTAGGDDATIINDAAALINKPQREGYMPPTAFLGQTATTSTNATATAAATAFIEAAREVLERPKFVGLVNQAMTCYLNSLLQALYMTPEFRNALYNWESDTDNEAKNIPYQLQKLFLGLQTSNKSAIHTTDLTRSFGWDSSEAWQQHDIQELCRVMFDALEHKFRNTKQANLISSLYEGKMLDYVKCLECNTEKTRADTFLDIPLPVRPFGSAVGFGSVEEALRGFVQPETLDGNNQYFCEKCDKKCDAHKGLKFKELPYILTLHLKRFDFDYSTMRRIKLNDRVTFPQKLNLKTFVNDNEAELLSQLNGHAVPSNIDDCSTTDSGSAMEEDNCSSGITTTASSSQHENDLNDDDEGIDMSNADQSVKSENEPYLYELFAIMIHSGSASGGHYYAYIKEFRNNAWYCFNDQNVAQITTEEMEKSFGGDNRSFYSSLYSSSTNAYMLMYRQMNAKRNERAMQQQEFPPHINEVLHKMSTEDEVRLQRVMAAEAEPETIKPRVYVYHPEYKKMKMTRVHALRDYGLYSVLNCAHSQLKLGKYVPLNRCRLVQYESASEEILRSYEDMNETTLDEVRNHYSGTPDFLLEYRQESQQSFENYKEHSTTWTVYVVDMQSLALDGPHLLCLTQNKAEMCASIAMRFNMNPSNILLATVKKKFGFVANDPMPTQEAAEQLQEWAEGKLRHLCYFFVNVPSTDAKTLEMLGISQTPLIEISADEVDAVRMNANNNAEHLAAHESPIPPNSNAESNSEDSSLSDGDRTLVESITQQRSACDSQISSISNLSPQMSSPDDEDNTASSDGYNPVKSWTVHSHDSEHDDLALRANPLYFHSSLVPLDNDTISSITSVSSRTNSCADEAREPKFTYKIIADCKMKMCELKEHMSAMLHIPSNCFKFLRKNDSSSDALTSTCLLVNIDAGETLTVELDKALQEDEQKGKVSFLRLSELNNESGRLMSICEWIFQANITVPQAKAALVEKLHRLDKKKYKTLSVRNCRLWEKSGANPLKIYAESDTLLDGWRSPAKYDFVVQECEEGIEAQPPDDSLTIFVRLWHADTLTLDGYQEITLKKGEEFKAALSQLSGIPEENICYAKISSPFPCTSISLTNVLNSLEWFSTVTTVDKYPLLATASGNVYFYRDASVPQKELNLEERRKFNASDKSRLDRLGGISFSSTISPRFERGLKIYVDSPAPKKTTTASPLAASNGTVDEANSREA